jgi:hypothetical protein
MGHKARGPAKNPLQGYGTSKSPSSVTFWSAVTATTRRCSGPFAEAARRPRAIAVGTKGRFAFQRLGAAPAQAQNQRRLLHRQQISLGLHQLQHEIVGADRARRNQHLEHRTLGMDVDGERRGRRQPAHQHECGRDNCGSAGRGRHRPHIFMPE